MTLTRDQLIQGLLDPRSGDYVDRARAEKVCVLLVGDQSYVLGQYSQCLPDEIQKQASRDIWSQVFESE